MELWFILALASTFLFGIQNFLYKTSAVKKYDSFLVTLSSMLTVAIASAIVFFVTGGEIINLTFLLWIAFLSAITMVANSVTKIEGLKYAPTSIFYSIMKSNVIIVLIAGILIFNEVLSFKKWVGVVMILGVIYLASSKEKKAKVKDLKLGLIFAFGCAFANAASTIIQKIAVSRVDLNNFLGTSYIFAIFLSLVSMNLFKSEKKLKPNNKKGALFIGFVIGVFIFIGFSALLRAIKEGPIAIVSPINNLSILIPIILSMLIYQEKITLKRGLAVLLAVAAVILLK